MWKLRPGKVKNTPGPANCKVRVEARAKGRGLDWTGHPWRHYGQNSMGWSHWGPLRPHPYAPVTPHGQNTAQPDPCLVEPGYPRPTVPHRRHREEGS